MHLCRFTWASSARGATKSTSSAPRPASNQCQRQECMCSSADSAPKQENSEETPCGRTVSRKIRSEAGTPGRASTNSSKSQSRRPKAGDRQRGDKTPRPKGNRQLFQSMKQLGTLQRFRKGENVPAPLTLQVSHDTPTISDQENSEGKCAPFGDHCQSSRYYNL
jgi:hypothetical protein